MDSSLRRDDEAGLYLRDFFNSLFDLDRFRLN